MADNPRMMSYSDDVTNLAKEIMSHRIRMNNMADTIFRSQERAEDRFGAHAGQSVTIEKYQKLDQNSSAIPELTAMQVSSPQINEKNITVAE